MRTLVIMSAVALLTACATKAPAPPVVTVECLPLTNYTAAQQKALAAALDPLPGDSPIIAAMADLGALRAADRACMASTK